MPTYYRINAGAAAVLGVVFVFTGSTLAGIWAMVPALIVASWPLERWLFREGNDR